MDLIIRAKLEGKDPEKGLLFESIPSKIKALIQKYPDYHFDFVICQLEDDPKKAKKTKYKNQKKVNTKNLKGQKFLLQLKSGDIVIKVDNEGFPKIEGKVQEASIRSFSSFLFEGKNIKEAYLFGHPVEIYCLGTEIKIHCQNFSAAKKVEKELSEYYSSVYLASKSELNEPIVEVTLLPSEILKLFLKFHI